jgi:hypothetical protein
MKGAGIAGVRNRVRCRRFQHVLIGRSPANPGDQFGSRSIFFRCGVSHGIYLARRAASNVGTPTAGDVAPLLAGQKSPDYNRPVPTIDLPADELAAVIAAIRRAIEGDRYPHAPRLDPLRAALGKFDAASEPPPHPKAAPPAKADKPPRSAKVPAAKISPGFKLGRLPPDR